MLTSKQDIINAYGHFFVLCHRSAPSEGHPDGYISRVYEGNGSYSHIGALDMGWSPSLPVKLEILEVFGEPRMSDRYGNSLFDFQYKDRETCFFKTLEGAEARADEIRTAVSGMYEELRGMAKKKTKHIDLSATPELPTVYNLQDDQLEFPALLVKDMPLFSVIRNVELGIPEVVERNIFDAKLTPLQNKKDGETFSYRYKLDVSISQPRPGIGDVMVDRSFHMEQPTGEKWTYPLYKYGETQGIESISFYATREKAEEGLRDYASKVFANIRHLLPENAMETPPPQPAPAPAP